MPMREIYFWLSLALFLAGAFLIGRAKSAHEGFEAGAVSDAARELFASTNGKATYTEYKAAVPAADPVVYTDVKQLWAQGRLSPETVRQALQ